MLVEFLPIFETGTNNNFVKNFGVSLILKKCHNLPPASESALIISLSFIP